MEPSLNGTALPAAAKNGKSSVVLVMSDRTFISRRFVFLSALMAEDGKYTVPHSWSLVWVSGFFPQLCHLKTTLINWNRTPCLLLQTLWQPNRLVTAGSSSWPSSSQPSWSLLLLPLWLNIRCFGASWRATDTHGWGRVILLATVTHQVCFLWIQF